MLFGALAWLGLESVYHMLPIFKSPRNGGQLNHAFWVRGWVLACRKAMGGGSLKPTQPWGSAGGGDFILRGFAFIWTGSGLTIW